MRTPATAAAVLSLYGLAASAATAASLVAISSSLPNDSNPETLDAGWLGTIDVGGALTAIGSAQNNSAMDDKRSILDIGSAQIFVQKSDGWLQFLVQAGAYALPSLGTPYLSASRTPSDTYGWVPQAFLKLAPNDAFSVEFGKLPSVIGNESTFTFQNPDIERGLLWNQTSSVSRGIQINYTGGAVTASLSWNDGYYANRFNWLTGLLSYALAGDAGTLTAVGGGNLGHTGYSGFATPLAQNNGAVFDLIYSVVLGRWTINPYIQGAYIRAKAIPGATGSAGTFGAALLASYKLNELWAIAGRGEYLANEGGGNLLYGIGSHAWSLTLTPTYRRGIFFARAEASYVFLDHAQEGFEFGGNADRASQARLMLETGVLL